ncbi:MAG: ATP-binding cassette domain-containing protein [Verrucomicrobia bacterium]|nr:ATP-binding cassette domain-containing protein [Verrucomicrobiota bacterium]
MTSIPPEKPPLLEVQHLQKSFGPRPVLTDVSFEVPAGEVLSILGRSGTGKSVLLKCIIGLLETDAGKVFSTQRPLRYGHRF